MSPSVLKFDALQSRIDASFWSELSDRKLGTYQLSEDPVDVHGSLSPSRYSAVGTQLFLDGSSFVADAPARVGGHHVPGTLLNLNTWDTFKACDHAAVLKQAASQVWSDISSRRALSNPALLCRFVLLSHADLKRFHFHYWFALPALKPPSPFQATASLSLTAAIGAVPASAVCRACDAWLRGSSSTHTSCDDSAPSSAGPPHAWLVVPDARPTAAAGGSHDDDSSQAWAGGALCVPLTRWSEHALRLAAGGGGGGGNGGAAAEDVVLLATTDPSSIAGHPGWPLRNLLLAVALHMRVARVRVLCVRESSTGHVDASRCLVLDVLLPTIPEAWCSRPGEVPAAVGWEADDRGRLLPRHVDLSPLMSPTLLADQAVGLNLRLMRWRAAPDLDVQRVADAKCLLLVHLERPRHTFTMPNHLTTRGLEAASPANTHTGAGTLGCAVSRMLLAWGCRTITLLDNGRVAYSNPVRQWLYQTDDCVGGGRPKAAAAAEALRRVWPSVEATALELSIPMPGHSPADAQHEQTLKQSYEALDAAVASHDVVFLLTDTRESRWLPSLLAAHHGKLAITAALGFDSFVVMRHGVPEPRSAATSHSGGGGGSGRAGDSPDGGGGMADGRPQPTCRLGCYFCNDVVAPLDSTRNRTLDQQCTVARPGLAPIASALAVEMLAALLQHPDGAAASAPLPPGAAAEGDEPGPSGARSAHQGGGALGPVPHMLRGYLSGFEQSAMTGAASAYCTACSAAAVSAHRARGWAFVLDAMRDPATLEHASGLDALHQGMDELLASDSGSSDGSGGDDW